MSITLTFNFLSLVHLVVTWWKESKIIDTSENTQMRSLSFFCCSLNICVFRKVSNLLCLFLKLSFFEVGWQCHVTFPNRYMVYLILLSLFFLFLFPSPLYFCCCYSYLAKRGRKSVRQWSRKMNGRMECFSCKDRLGKKVQLLFLQVEWKYFPPSEFCYIKITKQRNTQTNKTPQKSTNQTKQQQTQKQPKTHAKKQPTKIQKNKERSPTDYVVYTNLISFTKSIFSLMLNATIYKALLRHITSLFDVIPCYWWIIKSIPIILPGVLERSFSTTAFWLVIFFISSAIRNSANYMLQTEEILSLGESLCQVYKPQSNKVLLYPFFPPLSREFI